MYIISNTLPALTHSPTQASVCILLNSPIPYIRTHAHSRRPDSLLHLKCVSRGLDDCESVCIIVAWSAFSRALLASSMAGVCVFGSVSDGSGTSALSGYLMERGSWVGCWG